MEQELAQALEVIRTAWDQDEFDEAAYRAACEYLVDHRDALPYRVFFNIPGGLAGNTDPQWDKVKAGSVAHCSCGNEREILPSNMRSEYKPSAIPIVLSSGKRWHFRPVGGDRASTYVALWIQDDKLAMMDDPFGPIVIGPGLFSTPVFDLRALADALACQTEPAYLRRQMGELDIPILAVNAADPDARTVTITPDEAVEVFDPESETNATHDC